VTHWVFDCDGVLLNSNGVKTEAFRAVTSAYGPEAADDVVRHHLANGGVSRYVKLTRLFAEVLGRPAGEGEIEHLLNEFAAACRNGLARVDLDPSFERLARRVLVNHGTLRVVSGGDEGEIRTALSGKGVEHYFSAILGSPRPKPDLLADLVAESGAADIVYLGDSRLDLEMCLDLGVNPVFVAHWSEFVEWPAFVDQHPQILKVDDLGELLGLADRHRGDPSSVLPPWLGSAA